jgi:hypothetical protein
MQQWDNRYASRHAGWDSTFSVSFADSPGCVWQSIAKSTHAGIRAIAASVASATAAFTSLKSADMGDCKYTIKHMASGGICKGMSVLDLY